jgi:tetratricopeptide (TPR) repeat protein
MRISREKNKTMRSLCALVVAACGGGLLFAAVAAQAQVAPECVPAVRALQAGDLTSGGEMLEGCLDDGFGVERAKARLLLAELRARQGNLPRALEILDELDRIVPALPDMEPIELENGRVSIAAPGYLRRSARSPAPILGQAAYMRVIFLLEQARPLEAAAFLKALLAADNSSIQEESLSRIRAEEMALVQMAAALQQSGDAVTCAAFMREIPLEGNPKQPLRAAQIHAFAVLYAACHERAGAVAVGIAHYEELFRARDLRAGSSLQVAHADQRNLFTAMLIAEARLRMLQQDYGDRTRFVLDQAIKQGADVPEPRYMRAFLHLQTGDPARALLDAAQAERLLPGHPTHAQFAGLMQAIEQRM